MCARSASLQCGCVCVRVYASGSPVSVLQVLCSCACKSISGVLSADMFGSGRDFVSLFGMRVIPVEPCATVRKLKQIHVLRRGGEMGAITTLMSKAYRVFILLLIALRPPRLRTFEDIQQCQDKVSKSEGASRAISRKTIEFCVFR